MFRKFLDYKVPSILDKAKGVFFSKDAVFFAGWSTNNNKYFVLFILS